VHGNDALGLPTEVLGPTRNDVGEGNVKAATPSTVLDYYFRTRVAKRPLNEAKLILVGRGGVGKTSLVNRLLFDRFDLNEKKTDGIYITEWQLRLRDGEQVRLNLWDFGGQEIMHATHQFFLTQRSLYVLVLEGRQGGEDADAEYWLKLIESFGTESSGEVSPVLVVLNKIKGNPFDLNRRALEKKYSFIHGFIATDCKDRIGIEDLRAAVAEETGRLKHLRDAFPAAWFAIKDKLAGMKEGLRRSFISFDEYRALCEQNGEREAAAQDSLAFYLHSLGVVLNYKDDSRLRDTHVLDPHWVTDGIYTILNAPVLMQQKGELRLADVTQILDPGEYPQRMHRFLFDLMKKFELCFAFPDDDAHYLIPELLNKQEAVEATAFQPEECLNFEYRYTVLPEGLLPRFIVRTHTLSVGQPRWRTGVVLAFEGNRALVKADMHERKVSIAVAGPLAGRRRLLAIIRSDFERLHADISKLRPEALVPVPDRPNVTVRYAKLLALEAKGIRMFHEETEGDVVELDTQELLNGVDLEGMRPREIPAKRTLPLFYSYSHKDEALRNELETHLKLLQRQGLIESWHDRNIEAGDDWRTRIDENLERADIILLLVSADFVAYDYCYEKEMKWALERQDAGEAKVVPVIVREVNWKKAPFARLQVLPKNGRSVMAWPDRDAAWRNVSEGIERVAEEIRLKNYA
jgi:internalin A